MPHHRTLWATMDWSYELLSGEEQVFLPQAFSWRQRFHVGGRKVICVGEELERDEVLELLAYLVDKSLVIVAGPEGEVRFLSLETVRQSGWEGRGCRTRLRPEPERGQSASS